MKNLLSKAIVCTLLPLGLISCTVSAPVSAPLESPIDLTTTPKANVSGERPSPDTPSLVSTPQQTSPNVTEVPSEWRVFTSPNIVAPEEFEHGEYMILTFSGIDWDVYDPDYDYQEEYVFWGEGISSFEEGKAYYQRLNAKVAKYPMPENLERDVIWLSSSGARVETSSSIKKDDSENGTKDVYFAIFEDERIIFSCVLPGSFNEPSSNEFDEVRAEYPQLADNQSFVRPENRFYVNDDATSYVVVDYYKGELQLYKLPENRQIGTFVAHMYTEVSNWIPLQLTNENELLCYEEIWQESPEGFLYTNVYLTDLAGENIRLLAQNAYDAKLSPDGKFLTYCSPDQLLIGSSPTQVGYYILNLETQETVFYPIDDILTPQIVCWAKKSGVDRLMQG